MAEKICVGILSDNRLFRESLGRTLSKRGDLEILFSQALSEVSNEQQFHSNLDVVVLDSLEYLILNSRLLRPFNKSRGRLRVLLVAMDGDEGLFLRAVRSGALGFIPKDASTLDVVAAVRGVARGEAVCPPRFCKLLFDFVAEQSVDLPNSRVRLQLGLTRREQQLVPMIGRGLTNKEIAKQLNLSEQTIKNHVHRILHKTGVDNRLGILAAVQSQGLPN